MTQSSAVSDTSLRKDQPNLGWPWLLTLHLAPGMIFFLCFYLLRFLVTESGGTTYLALLLAIPVGLAPVELGIMLFWAKRTTGRVSLLPVLDFRPRAGLLDVLFLPLLLLLAITVLSIPLAPMAPWLEDSLSWVPDWLTTESMLQELKSTSSTLRGTTLFLGILLSGFMAPIVEEMYFRGFLLPRMGSLGVFAPFLNALLFALYHFYFPWNVAPIFVAFGLVALAVWKRKNIVIGIIVHSTINLLGVVQVFWIL